MAVRKWLHYDTETQSAFCYHCCKARHMAWTKEASTWVIGGFNQWNRGLEAIGNHEKSASHYNAVAAVAVHENQSTSDQQLCQRLVKDQADARIAMRAIVTTLLSLARQGLAIRGSTDEEGNLAEFLHRRAEDIPALKVWLTRETTRTSHDVQNEILELAATKHSALWLRRSRQEVSSDSWPMRPLTLVATSKCPFA